MNKSFYKMFPELGFGYVKLQSSSFSIQEAAEINQLYKNDIHYSKIHFLLIEVDESCTPLFNVSDLETLSHLYNTELQTNNHQNIVWLVAEPIATAMTHLFLQKTNDNSLYCSTIPKAFELLNLPMGYDEFKMLISQLSSLNNTQKTGCIEK